MLENTNIGYDVIGMVKKSENIHFRYNGRMQSAPDIFRTAKERRGRSKYQLSVEAEAVKGKVLKKLVSRITENSFSLKMS